jgi:hypothetical protein
MIARVCYLYGWPPRVPMRELSIDQVQLFLELGEEAQDMLARSIAVNVLGLWAGAKIVPAPKIVTEASGHQPADEKALDRFLRGHPRRGR